MFAPPQGPDALPPTRRTPPSPSPRTKNDSHVRLRAIAAPSMPGAAVEHLDAQELLDELCEEQLALSMSIACLENAIEQAPHTPAARAAIATLEARLADIASLRDALAILHQLSIDARVQRLFVPDSPLADYTRGLYAWAHAVVRALEHLATSLRTRDGDIDWALLRWRIEEAKNFHFDELLPQIRADVATLAATPRADEIDDAAENLFVAAAVLETRLDQRFG